MSRRVEYTLVVLVLVTAGLLRMGWPGLTEFKADEARLLTLAMKMAGGEQFAIRGLSSSVGFPNFPMSVWLYALPLLVWRHVYAATIFTGLLNTLAVAACYWFVRRYWGVQAALLAALMFAVSPWAIIFSRKIWAQNLLPLFVMGWVIGAAFAFVEKRPKFILLHLLCLAIAVQIHLAAIALAPATLLFLIVFRRRVDWRLVGIGVVLAVGTAVPFLNYLWQHKGQVVQLQVTGDEWQVSLDSLRYTATMSLGNDIHSLAGPEQFEAYLAQLPWMGWVYGVWAVLMMAGIGYWLLEIGDWRLPDGKNLQSPISDLPKEAAFIGLIWLFTPPLIFLVYNTPIFLHYFIATLPAFYILAGAALSRFTFHVSRNLQYGIYATLVITAVFQLYASTVLLQFLGQNATPGGFGTPLERSLETAETAQTLLVETNATEILIAGPGESPEVEEFPAVYHALLYDVPHRFVDVNQTALFPVYSAVVILADECLDSPKLDTLSVSICENLWLQAAVHQESIPLREGEGRLQVATLPPNAAPTPNVTFETPPLLANWVSFIGYDLPVSVDNVQASAVGGQSSAVGPTAVWQLYWHTGGNPDPNQYHFFVHLLDGQGQRVSQVDVPAFSPGQWQAVDTAVTRFVLTWPETAETLRVGMYQFPSLEPVYLLDVAGNPYSDAVEIQLDR